MYTTPNRGFPAETQGRDSDDRVTTSLPPVVSAGSAVMLQFLALAASTVAAQHAAGSDSLVGIRHGKRFAS